MSSEAQDIAQISAGLCFVFTATEEEEISCYKGVSSLFEDKLNWLKARGLPNTAQSHSSGEVIQKKPVK